MTDNKLYVCKMAKTPKKLPIDPSSDDPFYRYQTHQLNVQVVGRGKMIRTYFLNCEEVAADLHVPAECKFYLLVCLFVTNSFFFKKKIYLLCFSFGFFLVLFFFSVQRFAEFLCTKHWCTGKLWSKETGARTCIDLGRVLARTTLWYVCIVFAQIYHVWQLVKLFVWFDISIKKKKQTIPRIVRWLNYRIIRCRNASV